MATNGHWELNTLREAYGRKKWVPPHDNQKDQYHSYHPYQRQQQHQEQHDYQQPQQQDQWQIQQQLLHWYLRSLGGQVGRFSDSRAIDDNYNNST